MITKKDFILIMQLIELEYREAEVMTDELYDVFHKHDRTDFIDRTSVAEMLVPTRFVDRFIGLMSQLMNDVNESISWFVYETDWGHNDQMNKWWDQDGHEHPVTNTSELYDMIVYENDLKLGAII